MTIEVDRKNVYSRREVKLSEAKKELNMAQDLAAKIYLSRMNEPNEAGLINDFYYSVYHLVKCISVVESEKEYHSHSSLISYFCQNSKRDDYMSAFGKFEIDDSIRLAVNRLFVLRDEYSYRKENVEEGDYLEAEAHWLHAYQELENIVIQSIHKL